MTEPLIATRRRDHGPLGFGAILRLFDILRPRGRRWQGDIRRLYRSPCDAVQGVACAMMLEGFRWMPPLVIVVCAPVAVFACYTKRGTKEESCRVSTTDIRTGGARSCSRRHARLRHAQRPRR